MALPKINQPIYTHFLTGINKAVKYRPFTNKEQKILLLAKEADDRQQILNSIIQILDNCIVSDDVDVDDLPIFDIEDIFMRIRAKSVGEVIEAKYGYNYEDDGAPKTAFVKVHVNIDDVKVVAGEDHSKTIIVDDVNQIGITMKYPSFSMIKGLGEEQDMETIMACIENIFTPEEVFSPQDSTKEELEEFVDDIDAKGMMRIKQFFNTMPRLYHKTTVKNPKKEGEEETIEFKGLSDFFI